VQLARQVEKTARTSAWATRHAADKVVPAAAIMMVVLVAPSAWRSLAVLVLVTAMARWSARTPWAIWLRLLAMPVGFVALSTLPLLATPFWNGTTDLAAVSRAVTRAGSLVLQCAAASSAVVLVALSTPVPHLAHLALQTRVPRTLVALGMLTLRFVFILGASLHGLLFGRRVRFAPGGGVPASTYLGLLSASLILRAHDRALGTGRGLAARGLTEVPLPIPRTRSASPWFAAAIVAAALLLWWALPGDSRVY